MTVVAVMVDPPREGLVLPSLSADSPLSAAEAADLYRAMAGDVLAAVEASGGDLLVNYRPEELLPAAHAGAGDADAEAELRALAADALADPSAARFEVQVGSSRSARVGNTVTHLLERENADTAAVVPANAPLVDRRRVDGAAMKLRRRETVLGPATEGRIYYAGFADPVDFADALAPPALETLTGRSLSAGNDVDFLDPSLVVETAADLRSLVTMVRARRTAGRWVPERTADFLEAAGLGVRAEDGTVGLVREDTDRS